MDNYFDEKKKKGTKAQRHKGAAAQRRNGTRRKAVILRDLP
jgi:hypothetical protein